MLRKRLTAIPRLAPTRPHTLCDTPSFCVLLLPTPSAVSVTPTHSLLTSVFLSLCACHFVSLSLYHHSLSLSRSPSNSHSRCLSHSNFHHYVWFCVLRPLAPACGCSRDQEKVLKEHESWMGTWLVVWRHKKQELCLTKHVGR